MGRLQSFSTILTLAGCVLLAGCRVEDTDREPAADTLATGVDGQTPGGQPLDTAARVEPDLRLEVNIAARELHVYRGGTRAETHPVAVGSAEWPTRTGEWTIGQVVFNPRWVPPEEEWAEDREEKEPGAPDNPLGRAQLVYDAPRSIHGTNEPSSLGQAVSHGSIRVSNEVAEQLARQVMEAGGASRDDAFFRRVRENRSERVTVDIPNPVPIRVVQGG
jgi:lipoprotein-anchoring transpeptidase ErfK/SrfK